MEILLVLISSVLSFYYHNWALSITYIFNKYKSISMEAIYHQWWDEEVNDKYQVLKRYSYSLLGLAVVLLFVFLTVNSNKIEIAILHIPYLFIHFVSCSLVWYFDRKGYLAKSLFSISFSEFNCFVLWKQGQNEYKSEQLLFEMLSLIFINSFELPFVQTRLMKCAIMSKHLYLWHYRKYLINELFLDASYTPHMVSFLIIFLYNINSYFLKAKSYERFISRKNLENAESRLSVLFNLISDGVLVLSENKEVLFSNHNLPKLLCCEIDCVVELLAEIEFLEGKKYSELSESNKLIDHINFIRNSTLNSEIFLGVSAKPSNLIWRGKKVIWEKQQSILITVRDASALIQFEKARSENMLKNILLRSVTHELRTPINAISFIVEELMRDHKISEAPEHLEKLKIVSVSAKLLISLVNDLLDYSKMIAGAFTVQKSKPKLHDIISGCLQLIRIQAEKKGIQVLVRIDPKLPEYVYTDALRLSQILLNLLSNALKFTIKGRVELVCLLDTNSKLKIMVNDTGIGISESRKQWIFQEFHSDISLNINPDGCGLGLVISNKIVQELGGNPIEVISKTGKGSSFIFSIDIFETPPNLQILSDDYFSDSQVWLDECLTASIADFESAIAENKNAQVLIADDNDFNRMILGTLLKRNNVNYNEACTGLELIKKVQESDSMGRAYKVVVVDGSMPELNGWEATRKVIEMYFNGEIKFLPAMIGYTAFSSDSDIRLCLESGMEEVLTKPCSPEILTQTILKYLYK
ncbi:unnamed protein product [Blepharisma stoltei]|uniref:histidine kinase n=1 Tax=Blepharisma stoltei TaxID=1481888 RepID=A0AAU9I404_9CILI|nr:unnamed protein product [Blepharisma stoltei]